MFTVYDYIAAAVMFFEDAVATAYQLAYHCPDQGKAMKVKAFLEEVQDPDAWRKEQVMEYLFQE